MPVELLYDAPFLKKGMEKGTSVETFPAPHFEYKYYIDFPNTTLAEEDCSLTTSASISYCITQRNQFRKAFYTKVILLKLCYSQSLFAATTKKKRKTLHVQFNRVAS